MSVSAQQTRPKLIVNIVISQMRYDLLERFDKGFENGGFKRFAMHGTTFTDATYNYAQTNTPSGLATITTGANPSMHGVVSRRWIDYISNRTVSLIDDRNAIGIDAEAGTGKFSPVNLVVPTVGDKLKEEYATSRVITVAADPTSAVVMGGTSSEVYWLDPKRSSWTTSTYYMSSLPDWVSKYNSLRVGDAFRDKKWSMLHHKEKYANTQASIIMDSSQVKVRRFPLLDLLKKKSYSQQYAPVLNTPDGNTLVKEFVKQVLIYENIGKNETPDILNVCFDSPRFIAEAYGPASIELEDMYYRLDRDLSDLIDYIFIQRKENDVVIMLTADHGSSDAYDSPKIPRDRFNAEQFIALCEGFMRAQYGEGEWIIDFIDRQLYLNRSHIFQNGLILEQVQKNLAAFALQCRGVSHVMSSTTLTSNYFGGGFANKIQNSFYQKRSGDLYVNLLPDWIVEQEGSRAEAGSMYQYDTHVPLMLLGGGVAKQTIRTKTDMTSLAPTIAHILHIGAPAASEGSVIYNITTH